MEILELPGGLLIDGQIRRDFRFKPITGDLERAVVESGVGISCLVTQVSRILVNALDTVAGLAVSEEVVLALCSGDREYLMFHLQSIINPDPQWLTLSCQACNEPVQFQIDAGSLPVKPAGDKFPQTVLTLSIGDVFVRVPTGADEEAIACAATNHKSAMKILLNRLLSLPDNKVDIDSLSNEDQQLIDRSLDQMSPQPGQAVSISCPYCSANQEFPLDNYAWIIRDNRVLDEEVHMLAYHYHWPEKEILSLSKIRRKNYIKLIERNLGMYQGSKHDYDAQRGER